MFGSNKHRRQLLTFLQTTVTTKADMCTQHSISHEYYMLRGEGGGVITGQQSCQVEGVQVTRLDIFKDTW